ncbi:MAG: FHA domain-containing protein [Holophagaceae bacterium]|nr:FHA domain-containing protein [Holophagaceae bacterium]
MAKLLIHENSGTREFEIVDEEIRIGRELDNNLRISDPSVSRYHATLRRTQEGYQIQDQPSLNGIKLNGTKVKEAILEDGDKFVLGQVEITFRDS